jgi:putative transposase
MGDLFLLSERQMARISHHFPLSHGVPRVDDRRVVSGIIYVIRNGLQWKDAPTASSRGDSSDCSSAMSTIWL